jgi:lipoyl(octanoyl) transferase
MNEAETSAEHIDPCGYAGLRVTQACELGITVPINELQAELAQNLVHGLQRHFGAKQHPK